MQMTDSDDTWCNTTPATERDAEAATPIDQASDQMDHLTVPEVRLRPARSVKGRKPTDRFSLKFIPEGTTKKRRSHYRRLSESHAGGGAVTRSASNVSRGGVAKKVTFNTNRNSVVEIPEDIATVVERKMDQLGGNFKSLLAYTRELEEKVQTLTDEKETLEAENMELRNSPTIHVNADVDDTSL